MLGINHLKSFMVPFLPPPTSEIISNLNFTRIHISLASSEGIIRISLSYYSPSDIAIIWVIKAFEMIKSLSDFFLMFSMIKKRITQKKSKTQTMKKR